MQSIDWPSHQDISKSASEQSKALEGKMLLNASPEREFAILLSCKYKIPKETTQALLKDYIKKIHFFINLLSSVRGEAPSDLNEFIDKLSVRHNVPKEKLASMIIDYKILSKEFTILEP